MIHVQGTCGTCGNCRDVTVGHDTMCAVKQGCGDIPTTAYNYAFAPTAGTVVVEQGVSLAAYTNTQLNAVLATGLVVPAPSPKFVSYCCGTLATNSAQRLCYLFMNGVGNSRVYVSNLNANPTCIWYATAVPKAPP